MLKRVMCCAWSCAYGLWIHAERVHGCVCGNRHVVMAPSFNSNGSWRRPLYAGVLNGCLVRGWCAGRAGCWQGSIATNLDEVLSPDGICRNVSCAALGRVRMGCGFTLSSFTDACAGTRMWLWPLPLTVMGHGEGPCMLVS